MLETLLGGSVAVFVAPPQDENTLFRMVDFNTAADIKDKGPNSIAVVNRGGTTVGKDLYGSYMLFSGGQWLTLSSALLNRTNLEINFAIGSPLKTTTPYNPALFDARPDNTNGNYHILGLNTTSSNLPYGLSYAYPASAIIYADNAVGSGVTYIKIKITPAGIELYVNGALGVRQSGTGPFVSTYLRIGASAFSSLVPYMKCKVYYIDFKAIP